MGKDVHIGAGDGGYMRRRGLSVLMALLLVALTVLLAGCAQGSGSAGKAGESAQEVQETQEAQETQPVQEVQEAQEAPAADELAVDEDGEYTSKDEVALYLHTYGHLPSNYISKYDAEDAGWKTEGLSLEEACPGMSIGGDRFGNREGLLPTAKGRTWYECDIDYQGGNRNAKRIVYSNDGLIYYTDDHYQSFEQLY